MRYCGAAFVVMMIGFVASARAEDAWSLTTSDFVTRTVSIESMSADSITFTSSGAVAETVPLARSVQLSQATRTPKTIGLVLCVSDGQRLIGMPARIDGPNLVWKTDRIGELPVPLENLLAVLRDRTTADGLAEVRAEDQAKLQTGDSVRGILTEATADAFVFTPATGDAIRLTPGSVASVFFATPPSGRTLPKPANFLVAANGSVIACDRVTMANGTFALGRDDGTSVVVPASDVRSVEHTGGPVAWLSGRLPTESSDTPYFNGQRPARMDASVNGGSIQFGGVHYRHGIGVHSRSKLHFSVLPGDQFFRTRYAIDGSLPLADVDVRILIDGKVVHEVEHFRAGVLSPIIKADIRGAKTITLEVDYGGGYDVQDRLNWIEPAILRVP